VEARIIDVDAKRRRLSLSLRPKKEEREEGGDREDRPRREDRFRRDYDEQRGSRDRDSDRDRDKDRDRGDRFGDGLRTGVFDKLSDLDLENR
jgi:small subunit ribosomal protein S1